MRPSTEYTEYTEKTEGNVKFEKKGPSRGPRGLWGETSHYIVGAQAAERTIAFLRGQFGEDTKAWGPWLAENYYLDGRRRSLAEKTACGGPEAPATGRHR